MSKEYNEQQQAILNELKSFCIANKTWSRGFDGEEFATRQEVADKITQSFDEQKKQDLNQTQFLARNGIFSEEVDYVIKDIIKDKLDANQERKKKRMLANSVTFINNVHKKCLEIDTLASSSAKPNYLDVFLNSFLYSYTKDDAPAYYVTQPGTKLLSVVSLGLNKSSHAQNVVDTYSVCTLEHADEKVFYKVEEHPNYSDLTYEEKNHLQYLIDTVTNSLKTDTDYARTYNGPIFTDELHNDREASLADQMEMAKLESLIDIDPDAKAKYEGLEKQIKQRNDKAIGVIRGGVSLHTFLDKCFTETLKLLRVKLFDYLQTISKVSTEKDLATINDGVNDLIDLYMPKLSLLDLYTIELPYTRKNPDDVNSFVSFNEPVIKIIRATANKKFKLVDYVDVILQQYANVVIPRMNDLPKIFTNNKNELALHYIDISRWTNGQRKAKITPTWRLFMLRLGTVNQTEEERMELWKVFGATIWRIFYANSKSRQVPWFSDNGYTGKSTMIRAISRVLGTDLVGTFGANSSSMSSQWAMASFIDKRFLVDPDCANPKFLSTSNAKKITGDDAVTIERKHKQPYMAKVDSVIFIASNLLPDVDMNAEHLSTRYIHFPIYTSHPEVQRELYEHDKNGNIVYGENGEPKRNAQGGTEFEDKLVDELRYGGIMEWFRECYEELAPGDGNVKLSNYVELLRSAYVDAQRLELTNLLNETFQTYEQYLRITPKNERTLKDTDFHHIGQRKSQMVYSMTEIFTMLAKKLLNASDTNRVPYSAIKEAEDTLKEAFRKGFAKGHTLATSTRTINGVRVKALPGVRLRNPEDFWQCKLHGSPEYAEAAAEDAEAKILRRNLESLPEETKPLQKHTEPLSEDDRVRKMNEYLRKKSFGDRFDRVANADWT